MGTIPEGFGPPSEPEGSSPKLYGAKQRTRSAIAKSASRKGSSGERECLDAIRAVMQNVEDEFRAVGAAVQPRSENVTRRRLEKGKSREDISGIPLISIEVKRDEKLSPERMWQQCVGQATERRLPVLLYKHNRKPWRVRTMGALTGSDWRIVQYVVCEIDLPTFLEYYAKLYRAFLTSEGT